MVQSTLSMGELGQVQIVKGKEKVLVQCLIKLILVPHYLKTMCNMASMDNGFACKHSVIKQKQSFYYLCMFTEVDT